MLKRLCIILACLAVATQSMARAVVDTPMPALRPDQVAFLALYRLHTPVLYRIAYRPGQDDKAFRGELDRRFPDAGWRLRGLDDASPGVKRFVDRTALFLTLVGLSALLNKRSVNVYFHDNAGVNPPGCNANDCRRLIGVAIH